MISQVVEGDHISEFDNLYLDMNSILHTCTHSNDSTLTRMTEDQMFAAIFNYIDHLFDIIKPKEVFYMAIDGVAPRAKMNQQRARRFRTAYEAEENLKKAIKEGQQIPKEDPFDSNAITPGTEFMAKLTDNLKYFVHKKMTEDARWSNVKIILSGHEVPGEGEHKIMNFIRTIKSQENYNPNLRHCVYGLDADLIMLGLVTHDTHFSLLREEVTFGPSSQNKSGDVHDQKFFLLHLSLLREYMELEFADLENEISFEYNFERILDDFILIMYVIGNDFLPHLPDLHIRSGAFPLLIGAFKQSIRHLDGYLNEGGKINLKRLDVWLEYLSEFELENFEKKSVDIDWFNKRLEDISLTGEKKRQRTGRLLMLKDEKKLIGLIKTWLLEYGSKPVKELIDLANEQKLPNLNLPTETVEHYLEFLKQFALEANILILHSRSNNTYEAMIDVDGLSPYENEADYTKRVSDLRATVRKYQSSNLFATEELMKDTKDLYDQKFVDFKDNYYKDKLGFSYHDSEELTEMTRHYVEGLQWVLYYYYKGCPSWNWFYKYHYSPRISDVSIGLKYILSQEDPEIKFDLGIPFKPFEQLMAVLPARSRKLLPAVYRPLMTNEHSPIIDFYPHEVNIDLNGKTASWEAVVLLSFVDEKRLLEVVRPVESQLTPEEAKRNSYGTDIIFIFNPQIDTMYPSPLPGFFHDLEHDKCFEEKLPTVKTDPDFKFELPEGARLKTELLAGFPSLYTIPFTFQLALLEVKVFNFPSKSESMNLTLENIWEDLSIEQFTKKFMGKIVYTNWPFLQESRVTQIWNSFQKFESVATGATRSISASELNVEERQTFVQIARDLKFNYEKTKGVFLGKIDSIVFVQPVTGLFRNSKGAYIKAFAKESVPYPMQIIVESVKNQDERLAIRPPVPVDQEFPLGCPVVFLGAFAYGCPATVVGYQDGEKLNIQISKIQSQLEPSIGKKRLSIERSEIRYLPSFEAAKHLKISGLFLSKITGSFLLKDKNLKLNVGLDLKFEVRRLKALGYARKGPKVWEYSPLAIQLLKDYRSKFPKIFQSLQDLSMQKSGLPDASQVGTDAELKEVVKWLKQEKAEMQQVSLESESLTRFSIAAIEDYMEDYINRPLPLANKDVKGVPQRAVINPSVSYQLLNSQKFELGDRIIYVQESGKVPQLSKGTVVAINTLGTKTSLTVVFDLPLVGGNNMGGKLKSNRGTIVDSSLVLNISDRQLVYHSNASQSKKSMTNAERSARLQKAEETRQKNRGSQQVSRASEQAELISKSSNELLAILKKTDKNANGDENAKESSIEDTSSDTHGVDSSAIRQIHGQIYSSVMNQGIVPPAPTFMPQPIPVVPGIPLPPHFVNQQQAGPILFNPSAFQKQVPSGPNRNTPPNDRGRGGSRGRGSDRGRGRGTPRGRGRGRPAKEPEAQA